MFKNLRKKIQRVIVAWKDSNNESKSRVKVVHPNEVGNPGSEEAIQHKLQDLLDPVERMDKYVHITRATLDAPLRQETESWDITPNNSRRVSYHKHMSVSCSNRIIDPGRVKVVCHSCGGLDDEEFRCARCNKCLCRMCKCEFSIPGQKSLVLCKVHFKEAKKKFNSWKNRIFW